MEASKTAVVFENAKIKKLKKKLVFHTTSHPVHIGIQLSYQKLLNGFSAGGK